MRLNGFGEKNRYPHIELTDRKGGTCFIRISNFEDKTSNIRIQKTDHDEYSNHHELPRVSYYGQERFVRRVRGCFTFRFSFEADY